MSYEADDSEIEGSRAPLLEHLVELRKRLVICVIALVIGVGVCFAFSSQLLELLLIPFKTASGLVAFQNKHGISHNAFDPDLLLALLGLKEMPAVSGLSMQATGPLEVFISKLKIAAIAGIALTFPVIGYQIYRFVAPGLYKRERTAFLPFLFAMPFLFLMGAALVYYIILPFVMWFSLNQQIVNGIGGVDVILHLRIEDYIKIVTTLIFGFGLCFQMPVVLALLALAGFVDAKMLAGFRRYAIVGVTILAAILTPPDPISMMTLAVPLMLLYEISIWCVWLLNLRRKKQDATEA
jgi:sec-independent protein translocase protein TatC